MPYRVTICAAVILLTLAGAPARGEVFVRWTEQAVPARDVLGVTTLALPSANAAAIREALAHGYRVWLEVEAADVARVDLPRAGLAGVLVKGRAADAALAALRARLRPLNARVLAIDERGKWPHIRSNWVTKENDVLQVAGRTAQPWIENNAALARLAATPSGRPLLTYAWAPIAISDADEGPPVESYLVAIAEAGSFRAELLPVHARFQRRLLLGHPAARRDWAEIRQYIEFYAGDYPSQYAPVATIGVVTADVHAWFEVMNLLARHNLPFEVAAPADLSAGAARFRMLLALGPLDAVQKAAVDAFARAGGPVRIVAEMTDPNRLALEVRRQLGSANRAFDIWNGITVIAAPYREPGGGLLLTIVNYAHQPLPVQLRVPGVFAEVLYETPERAASLVAHEVRDGTTEFVLPALRVGGRVFLGRGHTDGDSR